MNTREVPVAATVRLDHRVHCVRPCAGGFAAVSADGEVTVLDKGLRVVRRLGLGGRVGDVAIARDGTAWAWAATGRLWLGEPGGLAKDVPLPDEVACRWLPSGQAVWVAIGTGDEVCVELRDPDHRVRATVTVPDPFGGSMVMLCDHPHDDAVVLWIAAGRDGQESWLLTDGATGPRAERLPAGGSRPALFLPDGRSLLTADDHRIAHVSWPDGAELGALGWADVDREAVEDGGDAPGELVLLPGGHVAWTTRSGRIRTVDLAAMSVVDEITLTGHPLRPAAALHPALAGAENLCTDFDHAVPGADGSVLTVHRADTLVLSALRDWSPA
ncbi:hypothetical protein [Actinophytocola glycyrrhizae]|uniref:WD40 repeat protein n=1 Tax=Actinophytocola glycyrrhizae TaxID=2044873 RepID=A0ABV9S3C6_9PSEU